MVEKPKRKAENDAVVRQSSRRVASSSRPVQDSDGAGIVERLITVRLDGGKVGHRGVAERLRPLVGALRNLIPNFKKFMINDMGLDPKKITKDVGRNLLTKLTDSPRIQKMAIDDNINNKEFIAALLDYAQEALGLPTEPRASDVALKDRQEDNTVDILCHKLIELGMYPERWPVPLTAAGMKKKNRPKSRHEYAAPIIAGGKEGEIEEKKEEEEALFASGTAGPSTTGRKRGRKSRNTSTQDIDTLVVPAATELTQKEIAGAAVDGGGGRRGSIRNVGKASLPRQMLDDNSDDDDNLYVSASEYEQEEEEVKKVKKAAKMEDTTHLEQGGRPSKRSKPLTTTTANTIDTGAAAGTSSRQTELEATYIVTKAHRQRCYWLRRTGLQAECFRSKEQRHDPPAPLKAEELTSCHDCQGAHVRYTCQGGCAKSYCQACCRHYEYLFASTPGDVLAPLLEKFCQGVCPCCLDICARKDCLRKRSKVYKNAPQVPQVEFEERKVMALHMARCLAKVQENFTAHAEREATRQNTTVAAAYQLPKSSVENYRLLCNRCATSMENVIVHCTCGADICPQCCADLMGTEKGPLQCPVCLQTTTTIQRVLTKPQLTILNNTQAVLDKSIAHGGAFVSAYDYNCKLWRLPTVADAVHQKETDAQGASGSKSKQKQSCMATAIPPQEALAAAPNAPLPPPPAPAAAAVALPNGNGIAQNGFTRPIEASALQNTNTTAVAPINTTNTTNGTVAAASIAAPHPGAIAKYQGLNALSLQLLNTPLKDLSAEQIKVVEAVFKMLVSGELQYAPLPQLKNSVARLAGATMHQVNAVRSIYASMKYGNNNSNNNGIAPSSLPSADGAGPSAPSAAARRAAEIKVTATAVANAAVGPNLVRLPTRPKTVIPGCIDLVDWHKGLPREDYRIASNRPDGVQNYIWTPHVSDFSRSSPRRHETVERFVQRWAAGEPIIIRGMRGRVNWGPQVVMRAARDMKIGKKDIAVTDCSDWGSETEISADSFFKMYTECHGPTHDPSGVELAMYKLKDFPPDEVFAERCKRHNDDFLEMLNACMPEYMHPKGGVLNLASKLPITAVPPDLGPKGYIAFGREKEHEEIEGDSVTRLHEDLSDAINILCHVQHPPGTKTPPVARCGDSPLHPPSFGGAGALWDLYRREDIPVLRQFILDVVAEKVVSSGRGTKDEKKCPGFYYKGKKLTLEDIKDPVHDQAITLTASHRAAAALPPYNLHPWLVEQYEFEGVVIPAACAHQVRNLRSCIKIALDFVSPESVPHCLAQREERRILAMEEVKERGGNLYANEEIELRHFHDKLQVVNMVVHGLSEAVDVLERGEVMAREVR